MKSASGKKSQAGERRRSERFDVQNARVKFRKKGLLSSGPWHTGAIVQVSSCGAGIVTRAPLDYGDKLEALLYFAAYPAPVHVRGRVVRIKSGNPNFEFGLEFLSIKRSDAEKLKKDCYLESLIDRRDSEII